MNGKFMKLGGVILMIASLLGAAWAFDKKYTPREITEMMVADLQKNQMQIQRNIQIQNAQQWLLFWQMQITELTRQCAARPWDEAKKQQLEEAKRQRNIWQQKANQLMAQ